MNSRWGRDSLAELARKIHDLRSGGHARRLLLEGLVVDDGVPFQEIQVLEVEHPPARQNEDAEQVCLPPYLRDERARHVQRCVGDEMNDGVTELARTE